MRVHELAKELGFGSKEFCGQAQGNGNRCERTHVRYR